MPGKILGLDISGDSVSAVQVKSGLNRHEVTACARVTIENGVDAALESLFQQINPKSDTYLLSIPGEQVSYRNLQMPFKDPKKIRQTLSFEIETMVPFPIEELVVDFALLDRGAHSEILAATVKKSLVGEYLQQLKPYGIDPEVLDIHSVPTLLWLIKQEDTPKNGLLVDIGGRKNTMIFYVNGRIALIRPFSFDGFASASEDEMPPPDQMESALETLCGTIRNTVHAFSSQNDIDTAVERVSFTGRWALYPETGALLERFLEVPSAPVNVSQDKRVRMSADIFGVWRPALMDHALALTLREGKRVRGFNFRKGEFEVKKQVLGSTKELRKAAILLLVVLLFLGLDFGVDYHLLKKRYDVLDRKVTEVYRKTFPEVTRVQAPVQEMKARINEIKKSAFMMPGVRMDERVIDLLKDISERVPKSMDVHVGRMVVDPETVQVSGDTDNFNTVDSLKGTLEPSPYFTTVTITSANLDRKGKRVEFDLKLQRRK
jgi:type II secretory pathway component PulL